jgi:hypothetical protein
LTGFVVARPGEAMGLGGQDSSVQDYVCQLPEAERTKALQELREDDNIREQSLDQMRDWINKHPNIKKCRTGTIYTFTLICGFIDQVLNFKSTFFSLACMSIVASDGSVEVQEPINVSSTRFLFIYLSGLQIL